MLFAVLTNFVCLFVCVDRMQLSLNGKRVDLIAPDIASTNVQDCGPIAYCPMLQPCGHGGTCSEVPARHDYECQCSADYKGMLIPRTTARLQFTKTNILCIYS